MENEERKQLGSNGFTYTDTFEVIDVVEISVEPVSPKTRAKLLKKELQALDNRCSALMNERNLLLQFELDSKRANDECEQYRIATCEEIMDNEKSLVIDGQVISEVSSDGFNAGSISRGSSKVSLISKVKEGFDSRMASLNRTLGRSSVAPPLVVLTPSSLSRGIRSPSSSMNREVRSPIAYPSSLNRGNRSPAMSPASLNRGLGSHPTSPASLSRGLGNPTFSPTSLNRGLGRRSVATSPVVPPPSSNSKRRRSLFN